MIPIHPFRIANYLQRIRNFAFSLLFQPIVQHLFRRFIFTIIICWWFALFQSHKIMAICVFDTAHTPFGMSSNAFDYNTFRYR